MEKRDIEDKEKRMIEGAYLNYLNRYLFEHGTISKKEYMLMTEKITRYINKKAHQRNNPWWGIIKNPSQHKTRRGL